MPKWKTTGISSRPQSDAILCVAFSPDGALLVAGHFDGTVVGYETTTLSRQLIFNVLDDTSNKGQQNSTPTDVENELRTKQPVTALAFRPAMEGAADRLVLLVGRSDGIVERRVLVVGNEGQTNVARIREEGNEVYAAAYHCNGTLFATCGLDATVRIYNDATLQLVYTLSGRYGSSVGEAPTPSALRLQAVRFSRSNPNIIMAAGWGQVVHFWDLSEDTTSHQHHREVFGPYAIGQAIDAAEGELVAVSFRGGDRLMTMPEPGVGEGALGKAMEGLKLKSLQWPSAKVNFMPTCVSISSKAADGEHFIAMGGGGGMGLTEAGMLLSATTKEVVLEYLAVGCVNCCAFGPASNGGLVVAFGDSKGNVQAAKYVQ